VVDDSRVVRKVARRILETYDFEITEAVDGAEALAACRAYMPDAILLDWSMPLMDGLEFLKRLREEPDGQTPVVIFGDQSRAYPRRSGARGGRVHHEAVRQRNHRGQVRRSGADLSPADLDFLSALVRLRSGLVLSGERGFFAETRLSPLARREGMSSVSELVERVKTGQDEALLRSVLEAMLMQETSFFRDRKVFTSLRDEVLPELRQALGRKVRVWSAGCGAGQEAYSLAMLAEEDPELGDPEIFASDLSVAALERAEAGVYTHFEVQRGLPIRRLLRHFTPLDDAWKIAESVRKRVRWRPLNLVDEFTVPRAFDIVLCRYVLDSFDPEIRGATVQRLARALSDDGWLILGAKEACPDGFAPGGGVGMYRRKRASVAAA
jgi:chemotaxis protein methyltransferase CheR